MCIAVARTVGGPRRARRRDQGERAQTGKGEATLVPLDLADMAGIDRLGGAIHERWGKLDMLVANAAMLGVISPIGHVEAKVFEKVMTINVTATWRLIRSVDPLLRVSEPAARSCCPPAPLIRRAPSGRPTRPRRRRSRRWRAHGRRRRRACRCASTLVDPGGTRTAMRALAFPGENPATLPLPSETAARLLPLADPALTRTGEIYQAKDDRWVRYPGVRAGIGGRSGTSLKSVAVTQPTRIRDGRGAKSHAPVGVPR